ncbi:MAG TPA: hypothetical protein VFW11_15900 [Cyclobacteriaceae bacterium]|nr:hypothetical protein [Cyclobacteriaceae bacterium]
MSKILFLFLLMGSTQAAMAQHVVFGNSFSYLNPSKSFEKSHNEGFAIKVNAELELTGPLSLTGECGWNKWTGGEGGDSEAWNAVAGLKLNLFGPLYAEGRAGYYFGEQFSQFVFIPSAGLSIRRFDFNLGYQMLYDHQFVDARVGFLWGGHRRK